MQKVYDYKQDYKAKKVIKISICQSCGSSLYIRKKVLGEFVHICAVCGNDTWS